jgi:phage shock protein C
MFCPHCASQILPEANFCPACGRPFAASQANPYTQTRIVRPRNPRAIAGVCSGFALHYGWDLLLTRILFVVFTLITSGLGVLLYIAAWILLPDALYALPPVTVRSSSPQ